MIIEFSIAQRLFNGDTAGEAAGNTAGGHRHTTSFNAHWGVAVGLAVMIISLCVIVGFKGEIRRKVMGFGGHIQVINAQTLSSTESQPIQTDTLLLHRLPAVLGIKHIQRFATKSCLLKTDEAFKGVVLKGIGEDYDTTFLSRHIVEGELSLGASDRIVISRKLAQQLQLGVGDRVFGYFFSHTVKARRYTVAAIYETHLTEFDDACIYTDLRAVQQLNDWESDQTSGVEILAEEEDDIYALTYNLVMLLNRTQDAYGRSYAVFNIYELYPGMFSWLGLLDTNVLIILALMLGLSAFTIISGLLIIILERTHFIAIMKSLGATNRQLRQTFLCLSAFLVGKGLLWGNVIGIGLCLLQYFTHLIRLNPATYYIDSVPIQFSWGWILLLNIATLILSLLVLILPTHLVSRIHPAKVMRYE